VSTMIERDDDIPALDELIGELDRARRIAGVEVKCPDAASAAALAR